MIGPFSIDYPVPDSNWVRICCGCRAHLRQRQLYRRGWRFGCKRSVNLNRCMSAFPARWGFAFSGARLAIRNSVAGPPEQRDGRCGLRRVVSEPGVGCSGDWRTAGVVSQPAMGGAARSSRACCSSIAYGWRLLPPVNRLPGSSGPALGRGPGSRRSELNRHNQSSGLDLLWIRPGLFGRMSAADCFAGSFSSCGAAGIQRLVAAKVPVCVRWNGHPPPPPPHPPPPPPPPHPHPPPPPPPPPPWRSLMYGHRQARRAPERGQAKPRIRC